MSADLPLLLFPIGRIVADYNFDSYFATEVAKTTASLCLAQQNKKKRTDALSFSEMMENTKQGKLFSPVLPNRMSRFQYIMSNDNRT